MTERKTKSIGEQYAGKCINFNGLINDECKAGVKYPPLKSDTPCFIENENITICEKRRFPTAQECLDREAEMEAHLNKMRAAFEIVAKVKKEHKGTNWAGYFECPACKGKLHISHARINGHVWGKCETEGCLAWME